jgi:hypothetical protein
MRQLENITSLRFSKNGVSMFGEDLFAALREFSRLLESYDHAETNILWANTWTGKVLMNTTRLYTASPERMVRPGVDDQK